MFDALHILKPGWYFNHEQSTEYWPDYREMDDRAKDGLDPERKFRSLQGELADLAYRSLQTQVTDTAALPYQKIHPYDEYRFIARYFNKIWLPYYLFNRLFRLKNPLLESIGFIRALGVQRFNWERLRNTKDLTLPEDIGDRPAVAVIIPTLNRFAHLQNALDDLYSQDYPNFEIIVVDQSESVPAEFIERNKDRIKYIHQEEKALWLARNSAIESTEAQYILLFDDDSRVKSNWISNHMKCLKYFNADISSGISLSQTGDKIPANYSSFRFSDQLDTGNVLIKREVFQKIGLFDRQFEKQRMGDGEFGLRSMIAGFRNISNPLAPRVHLKVSDGGLRAHGHWDGWRPTSWFAPRPVPSVLYLCRKYWGNRVTFRYLCIHLVPSVLPYRSKGNKWKLLFYIPFFPFLLIGLSIPVLRSWNIAGRMLQVGAKIKFPEH